METKDIHTNSIYLQAIEDAIEEIQDNINVHANLDIIKKNLNREFNANCTSIYIMQNNSNKFFGAYVFPNKDSIKKMAYEVVENNDKFKFQIPASFIIEIDSKLLYDLNSTPKEITAVLIHEVGHKIFSKDIQTLQRYLNMVYIPMGILSGLFARNVIGLLTTIPLTLLYSQASIMIVNNHDEYKADSLAVKYGYGVALHSILTKMMDNGEIKKLFKSSDSIVEEQRVLAKWSAKNIIEFSKRRNKIEKLLKEQIKDTESDYMKSVLQDQLNEVKRAKGNSTLRRLTEDQLLDESVKSFMEMKKYGMSNLERDEIRAEIDMMEIHEDKLYLLERTHKNIHRAKEAIRALSDESYKSKLYKTTSNLSDIKSLQNFVADMESVLKDINSTKIKPNKYGMFINYPESDYEEGKKKTELISFG